MVLRLVPLDIENPLTHAKINRRDVQGLISGLMAAESINHDQARDFLNAISMIGATAVAPIISAVRDMNKRGILPAARLGLALCNISSTLDANDPLQSEIYATVSMLQTYHQGKEGTERLTLGLGMMPLLNSEIVDAKIKLLASPHSKLALRHADISCETDEVVQALVRHTNSADPLVKKFVAHILASTPTDRDDVRESLRGMMRDTDPSVALQAIVALASQPGRSEALLRSEAKSSIDKSEFTIEVLGIRNREEVSSELERVMRAAFNDERFMQNWSAHDFKKLLDLNPMPDLAFDLGTAPYLIMIVRALEDNSMAGFLVASHGTNETAQVLLANLAVDKRYQGHDLAGQLLSKAEELFARAGYSTAIRDTRCEGGWAQRVENNLTSRGLLISRASIHTPDRGDQVRMVMRLPEIMDHSRIGNSY